jgi:predicted glycoside hydrolase/deacetylase ChbG (UPF0249 family)
MAERFLIVNADDFGQSEGVNRGVIEAHERGVVTSASLMVRWPAAAAAARYCRDRADFSLGIHLDLGEWAYREGEWVALYEVVSLSDGAAVADEIARQLEEFRRLTGCEPTHIDSHQHVHLNEPVRAAALAAARARRIPLRRCGPVIRYCGDFYGQTAEGEPLPDYISADKLIELIKTLPPGVTELGCHPGEGEDLETMYRAERAAEVKALCDPRVRATIISEGITLCSFGEGVC